MVGTGSVFQLEMGIRVVGTWIMWLIQRFGDGSTAQELSHCWQLSLPCFGFLRLHFLLLLQFCITDCAAAEWKGKPPPFSTSRAISAELCTETQIERRMFPFFLILFPLLEMSIGCSLGPCLHWLLQLSLIISPFLPRLYFVITCTQFLALLTSCLTATCKKIFCTTTRKTYFERMETLHNHSYK